MVPRETSPWVDEQDSAVAEYDDPRFQYLGQSNVVDAVLAKEPINSDDGVVQFGGEMGPETLWDIAGNTPHESRLSPQASPSASASPDCSQRIHHLLKKAEQGARDAFLREKDSWFTFLRRKTQPGVHGLQRADDSIEWWRGNLRMALHSRPEVKRIKIHTREELDEVMTVMRGSKHFPPEAHLLDKKRLVPMNHEIRLLLQKLLVEGKGKVESMYVKERSAATGPAFEKHQDVWKIDPQEELLENSWLGRQRDRVVGVLGNAVSWLTRKKQPLAA